LVRSVGTPRAWEPEVIDQAIPELPKAVPNPDDRDETPPLALDAGGRRVWRGEDPKLKDDGRIDRSGSLVKIGRALYDAGGERPLIVQALRERDEALGWRKYTGRHDAEERYHEIVDELESNGRNTRSRLTFGSNGHGDARPPRGYNLTDLGNAERFIAHHGENVRYCYPWRKWLFWTGAKWERDEAGRVHRLAKETVRSIYQEASEAPDKDSRKELAKHATQSEAEARIRAMLELAKSEVPVMPTELDGSPHLFNVRNGTIDLRSGEIREHRREDLITRIAPVEYDPAAAAPLWSATLDRVLPSPDLRAFFKKLCGYAISGETSEHLLPVLYGTGANGKSTVLNALLAATGDYGMQAAPDLLVAKKGSHPTELADLFGMRLVASIEVEDGRRLAESLVKQLTGGDRVKARRMREDFWEFEPTHTVFMAVNHKPIVRGTDIAIWRRIRLVPFTETIPPAEQDKKLSEKLQTELSGILAWAVGGCLEWRREGLQAPEEVRRATAGYRSEMDVLGDFLADRCLRGEGLQVSKNGLYEEYKKWCEDAGERAETKRKFGMLLKERGIEDGRNSERTERIWKGIGLSATGRSVRSVRESEDVSGGESGVEMRESEGPHERTGRKTSKSPMNSENRPLRGVNGKNVSDVSEVSEGQLQRIRKLIREGMSEKLAREEVLGKGWVEP
jgi:P4 family phage/plasmid primase-like protien